MYAPHGKDIDITIPSPVLSKISVLTIHVSDTIIHDSVFHLLTDRLGLPVEYYPVRWGERKYAGIYAGNMYLEPCGPYNNLKYARDHFKATFYGLNCESERSLSSIAKDLEDRNIRFEQNNTIVITDTSITKENMYFSISQSKVLLKIKGKDETVEDSLKAVLNMNNQSYAGIESIKEVWIGYTGKTIFNKWKDLIQPGLISPEGIWKIEGDQTIRFVENDKTEVMAIVFKVRSLERSKRFLMENKLLGKSDRNRIVIDSDKAFGLKIYFSE